ncbi:MAG: putative zinc-binding metallopeptidase [Bryobacteraceae bacterium]
MRHESGHYFWDWLVRNRGRLEMFREFFGDELRDHTEALQS